MLGFNLGPYSLQNAGIVDDSRNRFIWLSGARASSGTNLVGSVALCIIVCSVFQLGHDKSSDGQSTEQVFGSGSQFGSECVIY